MENIRHKKLVRLLKWIAKLALILEIIIVIFFIGLLIFKLLYEDEYLGTTYPVSLIEKFPDYQVSSRGGILDNLQLYTFNATLKFTMDSWRYYLIKTIEFIIIMTVLIGITLLAKKLFHSLDKEHPFTLENANRLKKIAFLILFLAPYSLVKGLFMHNFIVNNLEIEGKEFADTSIYFLGVFYTGFKPNEIWVDFNVNYQALLIGSVLLVLAEIFRIGVVMKEDNESIV